MVGIVDRLEATGLARRRRDPKDRRAHLVRITAKGRRVFEGCIPLQRRAVERVCQDLSTKEQSRLRDLLRRMLPSSEPRNNREELGDECREA
jgi:DNA-binding MarR family transcriptional regulator